MGIALPPLRSECARQRPARVHQTNPLLEAPLDGSSRLDDAADGCVSVYRREASQSSRHSHDGMNRKKPVFARRKRQKRGTRSTKAPPLP